MKLRARVSTLTALGAIMSAVISTLLLASASSASQLFRSQQLLTKTVTPSATLEAKVSVDLDLLRGNPEFLDLALPDGDSHRAERTGFERRPDGVTWRGTIAGQEIDAPATVTLTVHEDLLVGSILTASGLYEARPQRDRSHTLMKVEYSGELDCAGAEHPPLTKNVHNHAEAAGLTEADEVVWTTTPEGELKATARVDVLAIYSPSARAHFGGHSQIVASILHLFDAANSAFINSSVNVRVSMVRAREIQLSDAAFENLGVLRTHPPITSLRDEVGADLVSAFIKGPAPFCGRGYLMTGVGPGFSPWAYSVTDIVVCPTLVFAHEVGHNLGLAHDPANAGAPQDQSFPWAYGHFVDLRFRTIMSYNTECTDSICQRIPYFSHPGKVIDGNPAGIAGQRDNHRVLNVTGAVASRFRTLQATVDASFDVTTSQPAFGLPVAFADASSGQPDTWSWSFGDGAVSSQRNPTHTYTQPGTYTVRLTVSRGTASDTATAEVEVEGIAASWTTTPSSPRAGLVTQFEDASTGQPDTWSWDFGDGTVSAEQNPTHVYDQAGTYTVTLTTGRGEAVDTVSQDLEIQELACNDGSEAHCLNQQRFQVEVEWTDFNAATGTGKVAPFASDDSGMFWFFDANNWEMLIKVLDGCGINDHFWVFSAATTNVGYTLRITDSYTGEVREYENPLGEDAPATTDTEAFATCDTVLPGRASQTRSALRPAPPSTSSGVIARSVVPTEAAPGPCVPDATTLCLTGGRFRLEMDWRDFQGATGNGQVVPAGSDSSGLMWFFNPDNWEVLAKVLDGCDINDRYWVFAAATTNVQYTLRVTDLATGAVREYFNPLGNAAAAITDTEAFVTCD
ncbi:MAG: PKD domain-containing protein [Acidobacteriota bacterium]